MYNDYYLSSIDSKLNDLTTIQTLQQNIISNQSTVITSVQNLQNHLYVALCLIFIILCTFLAYYFYHNLFRHK